MIRETFIAKPGYAGKFAKMMKDEMANWKDFKGYVMLDFVTDYNKIVVEYEIESLKKKKKMMGEHKKEQAKSKDKDNPPAYTQLYKTGRREIFKVL